MCGKMPGDSGFLRNVVPNSNQFSLAAQCRGCSLLHIISHDLDTQSLWRCHYPTLQDYFVFSIVRELTLLFWLFILDVRVARGGRGK